jgi:hypothetical protein
VRETLGLQRQGGMTVSESVHFELLFEFLLHLKIGGWSGSLA